MISSNPFNLRRISVRVAQAEDTVGYQCIHRGTRGRTARIGYVKMIAICNIHDNVRGAGPRHNSREDVPFSGGNWPPACMKFLKDDAARLNEPSASVLDLDMSEK